MTCLPGGILEFILQMYINVQHDRANSTMNTSKSQGEMAAHPTSSHFEG